MTAAPQVSVVLPVRDDPGGLRVAAESVLAQRGVDLELVIVDDGSRDATVEEIRRLAEQDARVRPLATGRRGVTEALAAGCGLAAGVFIARHDADDTSAPGRLAAQVALLEREPGVELVSCWTACIGPGGEPLFTERGGCEDASPRDLDPQLASCLGPTAHGSVIFRRSTYGRVGGYRREFRMAQDWDLWWRLAEHGRFATVPEVLYTRRLRAASISLANAGAQTKLGALARNAAIARRRGGDERPVLERAVSLSRRAAGAKYNRRGVARGDYFLGAVLRANGDPAARAYFRNALRSDPLHLRAWWRWWTTRG